MSDKPAFPLDAEQIVRLTGSVLTRVLNAGRHPDAKRVNESDLTLALADSTGVDLPVESVHGYRRLLPPYSKSVTLPEELHPPGSILQEQPRRWAEKAEASSARQAPQNGGAGDA